MNQEDTGFFNFFEFESPKSSSHPLETRIQPKDFSDLLKNVETRGCMLGNTVSKVNAKIRNKCSTRRETVYKEVK